MRPRLRGARRSLAPGSTPALAGYDVVLADATGRVVAEGVPATDVAVQLESFESALRTAVARLDAVIPVGSPSRRAGPTSTDELLAVVELAAAVRAGGAEAADAAVAELELLGPVRAVPIGREPIVPALEPVREEINELVYALDGDEPEPG